MTSAFGCMTPNCDVKEKGGKKWSFQDIKKADCFLLLVYIERFPLDISIKSRILNGEQT